jgi:hypothetical protein
LQRTLQSSGRRSRQLAAADRRHGIGKILLLDTGGLPRHHDFLELEDVGLERCIVGGLARRKRDFRPFVPDGAYHQVQLSIWCIEGVPSVRTGLSHDAGSRYGHRCLGQAFTRLRAGYPAGNLTHLGCSCIHADQEKR